MKRFNEIILEFHISRPTLYEWIKNGCPVHYVGSIPFFDIKEVIKWIKERNK